MICISCLAYRQVCALRLSPGAKIDQSCLLVAHSPYHMASSQGTTELPENQARCCTPACGFQGPKGELAPAGRNSAGEITVFRCKKCNAARSRCSKVLKEHPSIVEIAGEINDMAALGVKCKSLYGDDLVATVRQHYTAKYTISSEVGLVVVKTSRDRKYNRRK